MVLLLGLLLYFPCKASVYAFLSITYAKQVQHDFGGLPALCVDGCFVSVHISVTTVIHSENGKHNVRII